MIQKNVSCFKGLAPFEITARYIEMPAEPPEKTISSHIHPECEIYIHLEGDVSFVVEDNLYAVNAGDIIITRPFEYHHCVYHSDKLHKHFWILFSATGNEFLFDLFFNRLPGRGNRLSLSPVQTERLTTLCHSMSETPLNEAENYYRFFELIHLLSSASRPGSNKVGYPEDLVHALNYVGRNFSNSFSVAELAAVTNVSVNTLERHFMQYLGITPSAYIRQKRLANAAKLLVDGATVTEASVYSGFSDYAHFIALFKKHYGVTPLQYKKEILKK